MIGGAWRCAAGRGFGSAGFSFDIQGTPCVNDAPSQNLRRVVGRALGRWREGEAVATSQLAGQ